MHVDLIARQREIKAPIKTAEIAITGGSPCSPKLFQDMKEVLNLRAVKVKLILLICL